MKTFREKLLEKLQAEGLYVNATKIADITERFLAEEKLLAETTPQLPKKINANESATHDLALIVKKLNELIAYVAYLEAKDK